MTSNTPAVPTNEEESITLIFSPGKDSVGTLAKALKLFKVTLMRIN